MPGLTCNACNKEFNDDAEQRFHYKSDWHRYNLKRKVAGVPGVTEALFMARQSVIAQEKNKSNETPMLYSCSICGKGYRSSKAHEQHLKSRTHIMRTSQLSSNGEENVPVIKPLPKRIDNTKSHPQRRVDDEENEESEDEWEEVDDGDEELLEEAADNLTALNVNETESGDHMEEDDFQEDIDPATCFMCDQEHSTIESCMVHMHRRHGFFIPDVEYLKDPKGLLVYLGLKVKKDFMCLYCNDRRHPFNSLEAVRKHMEAKGHCKVRFGDGGDDEEGELEEFYDYSSSYMDEKGSQMVAYNEGSDTAELGAGSELVIKRKSDNNKVVSKTLGSREYLRYYRQKPRPSAANNMAIAVSLASRYRSMGLATVQSREKIVRMKVLKQVSRTHEAMRTKIGMKNNIILNLPKNVPY